MIEEFLYDGSTVPVSERHRALARAIYKRRPYSFRNPHVRAQNVVPWDETPVWYQLELYEIAEAILRSGDIHTELKFNAPPHSSER